ncbi:hypothetical protein BG005_002540 [Podila minutissima]|nr:hypothetical protein BG005_002540 [Podila minutissima]
MSYPTTPCIKTLEFSYDWSATESTTAIAQSYECGLDFCTFGVKHFTTYLTFTLAPMTTSDPKHTTSSGPIHSTRSTGTGQRSVPSGCLSSRVHVAPVPPKPIPPAESMAPTPAASFLDRLYRDVDYRDVSFILNPTSTVATNETHVTTAHKVVLYQWSYFKRMFSSDFMEGGAGEKEIQVKDVKPQGFQLLLRFMYTGIIPQEKHPSTTFADTLRDPQEACWEDVFLAAHRYELDELCELAQKNLLEKLTPKAAIPFLFRTGYLFDSLRAPSIKFIASTSASHVASNAFRGTYQDHPDFGGLVFELFEAYHGNQ